jgi:phosphatidylinositol glycan class T
MRSARLHIRIRVSPSAPSSSASRSSSFEFGLQYLDQYPWFMRLLYHTLEFRIDGQPFQLTRLSHSKTILLTPSITLRSPSSSSSSSSPPSKFHFEPSVPRLSPHRWFLSLSSSHVRPGSEVTFSIAFDRAFMRVEEFPVDVARGFDIPAAVILLPRSSSSLTCASINSSQSSTLSVAACELVDSSSPIHHQLLASTSTRIYSDALLLRMPYPDFSMPFNVIAFTSTVLTFFFGSMFTGLFRPDQILFQSKNVANIGIVGKIRSLFSR